METEGLDFGGRAGVARRPLRRRARARVRGPARRRAARARATGCSRCSSARPPTTCACCGRARRPRRRASTSLGRGLEEGALREYRVGYSPSRWDRVLVASRSAGYTEEELLAAGLAQRSREGRGVFDRFRGRIMFPLADERGRVLGLRRAGDVARRAAEVPQHERRRGLPQGPDRLRRRPRARGRRARGAGRAGRGLHGRDRAAPGGRARGGLLDGHGADRRAGRRAGPAGAEGAVLPGPRRRGPEGGRPLAGGVRPSAPAAGSSSGSSGCPAGQDPADVVQGSGADEMRRPARRGGPGGALPGRAGARAATCGAPRAATRSSPRRRASIAPLGPSVLREELVKLVSGRLNVLGQPRRVRDRRPGRAGAPPSGRRRRRAAQRRRAARAAARLRRGPRRAGRTSPARTDFGAARLRGPRPGGGQPPARRRRAARWTAASRPSAPSSPTASRCPTRASAGSPRPTSRSCSPRPMTRRAAEYLRGRVRTPAADLPPDDEPLARLVAELVIRAGQLEATPAKLELEALQLDLSRLDRADRLRARDRRRGHARPRRPPPDRPRRHPPSPDLIRSAAAPGQSCRLPFPQAGSAPSVRGNSMAECSAVNRGLWVRVPPPELSRLSRRGSGTSATRAR